MKNIVLLALGILFLASTKLIAQTNPCTQDTFFHIVVLGSSTAAGSGASPSDSSWVNRYRAALQGLNPAYQVTNRAQGGFVTYRLMPTGFFPPSGRPNPDTTRNITYAIGLNPDAIIVNLPSNDVSSGYTVAEQLSNFDSIHTAAQLAGIPIWICTTQPKNYSNATNIQKQIDVRDSIWARYSPLVLDFWTGLADSSNQIDPQYDSGDGTHLNNAGHFRLFRRAFEADLPAYLYQGPAFPDLSAFAINPVYAPVCGDSFAQFEAVFLNRGPNDPANAQIALRVTHIPSNTSQTLSATSPTPGTCTFDTSNFTVNTALEGNYIFEMIVNGSSDLNPSNDTLVWSTHSLGIPEVIALPDTGCAGSNLLLEAVAGPNDSIRWYDAAFNGNLIGSGQSYSTPPLNTSTNYYVQAFRGDFVFRNQLSTTTNSNINWNGTMFDLVADSNLVLDSLALKVTTAGMQTVRVYTRPGTHLGYETNPAAWTLQNSFPVMVNDPTAFVTIGSLNLSMNATDTLGVYLELANSGSTLGYQSGGQAQSRRTDELTILTGSGASYNFGGNFYPRDWNGTVFYHFGSRPDGDCASERVAVPAMVGSPQVDLGNDTILNLSASYALDAGPNALSYLWSDGSTNQTLVLNGATMGTGVFTYIVTVTDSLGCMASDTVIVVFAPLVGLETGLESRSRVWPSPARNWIQVELSAPAEQLVLYDLHGKMVKVLKVDSGEKRLKMKVSGLAKGLYLLEINGDTVERHRVFVTD